MNDAPYNYSKLLGRIKELGMTQDRLSREIRMNPATLSLKLNNKNKFRQDEIRKICSTLEIRPDEIGQYFFTH